MRDLLPMSVSANRRGRGDSRSTPSWACLDLPGDLARDVTPGPSADVRLVQENVSVQSSFIRPRDLKDRFWPAQIHSPRDEGLLSA